MKTIHHIPNQGADKGKVFVITRMSAFQADQWARRIIMSLCRNTSKDSERVLANGIMGISETQPDIFAHLEEHVTEEALLELRSCVKIKRDPRNPALEPMDIMEEDLEDPYTLQNLYKEAYKINVDFLKAAVSLIQ